MKKKVVKLTSWLGLVFTNVVAFSSFVSANGGDNLAGLKTEFTSIQTGIQVVSGAVVVVAAAITAIMYMSSVVNPNAKKTAKEALVATLIGVVILALSTKAPDILNSFFSTNVLQK